jgi:tetrahydromethanopterin S-methyltransferase subunit E
MDIIALIALVVAITQVVKQVIKIDPNIIAVFVSVLVVAYKAVATGTPFTFALIVILVQVVLGAIGSFKVAKQVLSPTPR